MTKPLTPRLTAALTAFSLVFPVVYTVAYYNEWAVFRFYPAVGELHLDLQSPALGPSMVYYGWVAASALVSLIAAVLIPARWTSKLWAGWSWLVPLAAALFMFAYETRWLIN